MKLLIIPDVHLKPWMFEQAAKILHSGQADNAICLGDLADDWQMGSQIELYKETYEAAINLAKEFPDSLWCYGNHDVSYLWRFPESGYSKLAENIVPSMIHKLNETLPESNPIKFVHLVDNIMFSHGGVGECFVKDFVPFSEHDNLQSTIDIINTFGPDEMWLDYSPIWLRPKYYNPAMYGADKGILQVIGHTPSTRLKIENNILSCDVFSSHPNGGPIGPCVFPIIDTVTKEFTVITDVGGISYSNPPLNMLKFPAK